MGIFYNSMLYGRFNLNINLSIITNLNFIFFDFTKNFFKFFKIDFGMFSFRSKNFLKISRKYDKLKNIIFFKKKTSIFKKKDVLNLYFLKRLNFVKSKKNLIGFEFKRFKKVGFFRYIDLHRKTNQIWFNNRIFLKNFINFKKLRQFSFTRFLSSILKCSKKKFINFFENSLANLLICVKFVFTLKDSLFLIKNGLIFRNGVLIKNGNFLVNVGDVVQVMISDMFYNFYKWNFHFKIKKFRSISYHIWLISRFKFNFYKQSKNRVPKWIHNLYFVYEDVPPFLEIDYIILAFCFLYERSNFVNSGFLFKKIINIYLLRHYNWKYVV